MKSGLDKCLRFVEEDYYRTVLILFAGMTTAYCYRNHYIADFLRTALPVLLIILVFVNRRLYRVVLLSAATLILALVVLQHFYQVPNHAFFITYISAALLICLSSRDCNDEYLQRISAWLLATLMGFALIQKLTSPYYLSGNLMADYLLSGFIYKNIIGFFDPLWIEITASNLQARLAVSREITPPGNELGLTSTSYASVLVWGLTFSSIAIQFLLELAIIFRSRLGVLTHYGVLLFVAIIYSTVNENVFLSANCILGYSMSTQKTKSVRKWYVLVVGYLILSSLLGYRPSILS